MPKREAGIYSGSTTAPMTRTRSTSAARSLEDSQYQAVPSPTWIAPGTVSRVPSEDRCVRLDAHSQRIDGERVHPGCHAEPREETSIDDAKGFRKTYGFTAGQFHPEINHNDLLPAVSYTGGGLQNTPSFGNYQAGRFRSRKRIISTSIDISRSPETTTRSSSGIYAEKDRITTGSGFQNTPTGVSVSTWMRTTRTTARHPFANGLLGNFTAV